MKNWFYFGVICLVLLEIANVYFIMPMPGSQKMDSLDLSYTLYKYRWIWRSIFYIIILIGLLHGLWKQLWIPAIPLLILTAIIIIEIMVEKGTNNLILSVVVEILTGSVKFNTITSLRFNPL